MEVEAYSQMFSQEWDDILTHILDSHIKVKVGEYTLGFTVVFKEDKPWWYFGFTRKTTVELSVWINNYGYGTLYSVDGKIVPESFIKYPSKKVLDKLELWCKLHN